MWSHHVQGVSVNTHLQRQLIDEQEKARHCLKKLFTSIEYLARQALPMRGLIESSGNFFQLRADDSHPGCLKEEHIHHMKYKMKCFQFCHIKYSALF